MTFIHVMTPQGRLNADQRRKLAKTLTDAVLVPEVANSCPKRGAATRCISSSDRST